MSLSCITFFQNDQVHEQLHFIGDDLTEVNVNSLFSKFSLCILSPLKNQYKSQPFSLPSCLKFLFKKWRFDSAWNRQLFIGHLLGQHQRIEDVFFPLKVVLSLLSCSAPSEDQTTQHGLTARSALNSHFQFPLSTEHPCDGEATPRGKTRGSVGLWLQRTDNLETVTNNRGRAAVIEAEMYDRTGLPLFTEILAKLNYNSWLELCPYFV